MKRSLALILALALAACAGPGDDAAAPTPEPAADPIALDWSQLHGMEPIEVDGWELSDCDPGEAPLLCVSADGTVLGMLEATTLIYDEDLGLETFSAQYQSDNRQDRLAGCPEGYRVRFEPDHEMSIDGRPGVRNDFSVFDAGDRLVERTVTYHVIDGDRSVGIVAHAFAEQGSCLPRLGSEFDPEQVEDLRPLFDRIAAGSMFPDGWDPAGG